MALISISQCGNRVGEQHHRSTIPDKVVDQIRDMREERGSSYGRLALLFQLPKQTVAKICRYERRTAIAIQEKRI